MILIISGIKKAILSLAKPMATEIHAKLKNYLLDIMKYTLPVYF